MLDYIGQNKIASEWLLEYPARRQAYLNKIQEFSYLSAMTYSGLPGGTDIGCPTEIKSISLADQEKTRLWIITIEKAESCLNEKKLAFLDARRWAYHNTNDRGRPGWTDITLQRYSDWFYRKYGRINYPDRHTMYKWWEEILNITIRIAIKTGCL